jgi:hypothetical protein
MPAASSMKNSGRIARYTGFRTTGSAAARRPWHPQRLPCTGTAGGCLNARIGADPPPVL